MQELDMEVNESMRQALEDVKLVLHRKSSLPIQAR